MRVSDLLIDLNDIYGRLIPGMFLIIDLYLVVNLIIPIDHAQILDYLKENLYLSTLFILVLLIILHIVGEFSLYPIFGLHSILPRKTPLEYLTRIDVTKERDVISHFKSTFSTEALNSKTNLLMDYCKNYLLENSFQAYVQSRKNEARINLWGGMVIPLIVMAIICILYQQWVFSITSIFLFLLAIIFFDRLRKSFEGEQSFVYKAYYSCYTNLHRFSNEGKSE